MTARKGVKGEKELPSLPPLVALPASRRVAHLLFATASLRSAFALLFSGEIFEILLVLCEFYERSFL